VPESETFNEAAAARAFDTSARRLAKAERASKPTYGATESISRSAQAARSNIHDGTSRPRPVCFGVEK
jgi:hypothetical protein